MELLGPRNLYHAILATLNHDDDGDDNVDDNDDDNDADDAIPTTLTNQPPTLLPESLVELNFIVQIKVEMALCQSHCTLKIVCGDQA